MKEHLKTDLKGAKYILFSYPDRPLFKSGFDFAYEKQCTRYISFLYVFKYALDVIYTVN